MRILLPVKIDNEGDFFSSIVPGGIEKFSKELYNLFPDVFIPIEITKEIRSHQATGKVFKKAIEKYVPDAVLSNEVDTSFTKFFQKHNIPLMMIIHRPLSRDPILMGLIAKFQELQKNDVHVYFVSENQYRFHKEMFKRIAGLELNGIKGYINPSYVDKDFKVKSEHQYDCCTIGRNDFIKDPFWVHRKAKDTGLSSLVITGSLRFKQEAQKEYYEKNLNWQNPQYTVRDLPYVDVIDKMSSSKVFVATCYFESWGIAAMEALSCGLPLLIVTDIRGNHSSIGIASNSSEYLKIRKNANSKEFKEKILKLSEISYEQRLEIAENAKNKHSKENFKKQIEEMIDRRMSQKENRIITLPSLERFFND